MAAKNENSAQSLTFYKTTHLMKFSPTREE